MKCVLVFLRSHVWYTFMQLQSSWQALKIAWLDPLAHVRFQPKFEYWHGCTHSTRGTSSSITDKLRLNSHLYGNHHEVYARMQFLKRMAQPYDKKGGGNKTLLSQEDLEKMASSGVDPMLFWGSICSAAVCLPGYEFNRNFLWRTWKLLPSCCEVW